MLRKIDLMYDLFGKSDGKCKNCQHYKYWKQNEVCARSLRKCEIYGITASEASDWKASYRACGLFPDKEPIGIDKEIITLRKPEKKQEEQIDGQINLFDSV